MFVLKGTSGEYEDRVTWVEVCSADLIKLEAYKKALEEKNALKKEALKEYRILVGVKLAAVDSEIEALKKRFPRPERAKPAFTPRTKEEHAARTKVVAQFDAVFKAWTEEYSAAYDSIVDPCRASAKKELLDKYGLEDFGGDWYYYGYEEPKYSIKEVKEI